MRYVASGPSQKASPTDASLCLICMASDNGTACPALFATSV